LSCGTRFYDLNRQPIVCPSCSATFEPEAFLRTRRSRAAPVEATKAPARPVSPAVEADADVDVDVVDVDVDVDDVLPTDDDTDTEAEEEEILEDASELGEDVDDMAEVIENVDSKEKEP
jgi:uncharacterized protein (TIGR02300 family)